MKHIACFHLFNDYSGSPKVLYQVLNELLKKGYSVDLITSKGGILSTLEGRENLHIRYYNYQYSENPVITMARYFRVQLYTFLLAIGYLFKKDTIFYINTLLPLGPAIGGRLIRKQVFYHYHENASVKGFFYKVLSKGMQKVATKIICVSSYQSSFLKRKKGVVIIPNALSENFCNAFKNIKAKQLPDEKIVLMLSSLKIYKGILEFIKLAHLLPQYTFNLVVNDTSDNIDLFFENYGVKYPRNLKIFDRQGNTIPFFQKASLVVNLSDRTLAIETFGLTVLEAMTAALPVIVPTEGGIAELVEDQVSGYKIDVQDLDEIVTCINSVFCNPELYYKLSNNAKSMSKGYDTNKMFMRIQDVLEN